MIGDDRRDSRPIVGGPRGESGRRQSLFLVGDWLVEPLADRIRSGSIWTHVEPRVMNLLLCLAEKAGKTVTREELRARVWPDCHVGEDALNTCVSRLRRALRDDGREPRIIETVPKIGYRLVAAVSWDVPE